jgi:hypothetical protein
MQIEVRVIAAPGAPSMGCQDRLSDLGCLLRERVASMALDWPALGFLRIEPERHTLRIVLAVPRCVPAMVAAAAVARAIRRETADVIRWGPRCRGE